MIYGAGFMATFFAVLKIVMQVLALISLILYFCTRDREERHGHLLWATFCMAAAACLN